MHRIKYAPQHYDEHLSLKVPVTLWLAMAFLVRHLLLLGITFLPTTGREIVILRDLVQPEYLIADLIALPVLVTAMRRGPRGPRWLPRIWTAGPILLSVAAMLYPLLLGIAAFRSARPVAAVISEASLVSALISLAIFTYIWRSPLVRDLFRDWPSANTDKRN
jgi:hypothetical protein